MSTRLTYTSGDLGAETDAAFEAALEAARGQDAGPHAHLIGGETGGGRRASSSAATPRAPSRWRAARTRPAPSWWAARSRRRARRRRPGPPPATSERCRLLRAVADGIGARHMELAALASLETGKSRTESILEVQEAIDLIEAYAGHMEENEGYTQPLNSFVEGERNVDVLRPVRRVRRDRAVQLPRRAVGGHVRLGADRRQHGGLQAVRGVARDRRGCSPRSCRRPGFRPVPSTSCTAGPDTGRALVDAPVDGVAFTGSAEVGREIARKMQEGPYARPALTEMGGKNPAIVTASADMDAAAEGVARSAFGLSGQKCSACSRAIVVDSVHDEFVERLAARAAELALGDPSDREAFVGPVINEGSVERFERAVAAAEREGRVAAGGARPDLPGHFVEPTVVAGSPARARARARRAVPAVRDGHARGLVRRGARRGERARSTGSRPGSSPATRPRRSASWPRSRRASST